MIDKDKKWYTEVQLYDIERIEYRYLFDTSLIPDGFDCLEKAKEYHKSLNRPIIPEDKVDISEQTTGMMMMFMLGSHRLIIMREIMMELDLFQKNG